MRVKSEPGQSENEDDQHSDLAGSRPLQVLGDEPAEVIADVEELKLETKVLKVEIKTKSVKCWCDLK